MRCALNARMERLIELWGSLQGIADALELPYPTVASWNARGVPAKQFRRIVETARAHGHEVQLWELSSEFDYLRPCEEDAA